MSRSVFAYVYFNDEVAAYAFVEARLWAKGRVCPHCGVVDKSGALKGKHARGRLQVLRLPQTLHGQGRHAL